MTESEVTCENCGYDWVYSGDMPEGAYVTCPACRNKTQMEVPEVDT